MTGKGTGAGDGVISHVHKDGLTQNTWLCTNPLSLLHQEESSPEDTETPVPSLAFNSHFSRNLQSGRSSRERPSFSAKANGTADWQETKQSVEKVYNG